MEEKSEEKKSKFPNNPFGAILALAIANGSDDENSNMEARQAYHKILESNGWNEENADIIAYTKDKNQQSCAYLVSMKLKYSENADFNKKFTEMWGKLKDSGFDMKIFDFDYGNEELNNIMNDMSCAPCVKEHEEMRKFKGEKRDLLKRKRDYIVYKIMSFKKSIRILEKQLEVVLDALGEFEEIKPKDE